MTRKCTTFCEESHLLNIFAIQRGWTHVEYHEHLWENLVVMLCTYWDHMLSIDTQKSSGTGNPYKAVHSTYSQLRDLGAHIVYHPWSMRWVLWWCCGTYWEPTLSMSKCRWPTCQLCSCSITYQRVLSVNCTSCWKWLMVAKQAAYFGVEIRTRLRQSYHCSNFPRRKLWHATTEIHALQMSQYTPPHHDLHSPG